MKIEPPIKYNSEYLLNHLEIFENLKKDLNWERRGETPRCEYYINDLNKPYTYGVGRGERTYFPQVTHPDILSIKEKIENEFGCKFEACFLNRYLDQSDHLGWHADDSLEMDSNRPIIIISLGTSREIWFRKFLQKTCVVCLKNEKEHIIACSPIGGKQYINIYSDDVKLKLISGSLCVMLPHMQEEWQHRIPKSSSQVGERISLTFRGFKNE